MNINSGFMSKGYYKPDGNLFVLVGANKMEGGGGLITVLYGTSIRST